MKDSFLEPSSNVSQSPNEKKSKPPKRWFWFLFGGAPFLPEIVWEKLAEAVFVAIIGGLIYGYFAWWVRQG